MAAGMNRERRVANLEQRTKARFTGPIPMLAAEIGESADKAVARYIGQHGPLSDGEPNVIVFVPFEATA